MKKRPVTFALLGIAAVLAGLFALYRPFRDMVTILGAVVYYDIAKPNDPITRTIRTGVQKAGGEWGSPVSLTPAPLRKGGPQADAIAQLTKVKYEADSDTTFSTHKPRTFPEGSLFFRKSVEGLPCAVEYKVVLVIDADGRIDEAYGTEDEVGCL